jgi:hypothetical protein
MPTLPPAMLSMLAPCAPPFSRRDCRYALMLVASPIFAPGRRTLTAALRAAGSARGRPFERYPCVLLRAKWSGLAGEPCPARSARDHLCADRPDGEGD